MRLFFVLYIGLFIASASAQTYSGTYQVAPSGGDFTTINAAVQALASGVVTGPVTIEIASGNYAGSVNVPNIPGSSALNKVVFTSKTRNPKDVTLFGSTTYVWRFNECNNVGLENVSIESIDSNNFVVGIQFSQNLSPNAELCKFNSVNNCIVKMNKKNSLAYSIYIYGLGTAYHKISNNTLIGGTQGIYNGTGGTTIHGNRIYEMNRSGIALAACDSVKVLANWIHCNSIDLGAAIGANNATNLLIANNMVLWESPNSSSCDGINVFQGSTISVYHNTIVLNADSGSSNIEFTGVNGNANTVFNNILENRGKGFTYLNTRPTGSTTLINTDYNVYSTNGKAIAFLEGNEQKTLANLQSFTGKDANSYEFKTIFNTEEDIHTLYPPLDAKGTPVASVTKDFDGENRNASTPDIGADEFTALEIDLYIRNLKTINPPIHRGDSVVFTIDLLNNGKQSLVDSTIEVSLSIDNGKTWFAPEIIALAPLSSPFSSFTFELRRKWLPPKAGIYACKLAVSKKLASDGNLSNDSSVVVKSTILQGNYTIPTSVGTTDTIFEILNTVGVYDSVFFQFEPGVHHGPFVINNYKQNNSLGGGMVLESLLSSSPAELSNDSINRNWPVLTIRGVNNIKISTLKFENGTGSGASSGIQLEDTCTYIDISNNTFLIDTLELFSDAFGIKLVQNNVSSKIFSLKIRNNKFHYLTEGIKLAGDTNTLSQDLIIFGNEFVNCSNNAINLKGIRNLEITENQVSSTNGLSGSGFSLLDIYSNLLVEKNQLSGLNQLGISIGRVRDSTSTFLIANNMIGGGFKTAQAQGLKVFQAVHPLILNNSVLLDAPSNTGSGIEIINCDSISLYNNIAINKGGGYALKVDTLGLKAFNADYNCYHSYAVLVEFGSDYNNLNDYQLVSSKELNSMEHSVQFLGTTNLHTRDEAISDKGISLSLVTQDIDGQARKSNPDIGADEFDLGKDVEAKTVIVKDTLINGNVHYKIQLLIVNAGSETLSLIDYNLTVNGENFFTDAYSNQLEVGDSAVVLLDSLYLARVNGTHNFCLTVTTSGDVNLSNNESCREFTLIFNDVSNQALTNRFILYPNPAATNIAIEKNQQKGVLTIFNMQGILVLTKSLEQTINQSIDISQLTAGMYLVRYREASSGFVSSQKLIIQ